MHKLTDFLELGLLDLVLELVLLLAAELPRLALDRQDQVLVDLLVRDGEEVLLERDGAASLSVSILTRGSVPWWDQPPLCAYRT